MGEGNAGRTGGGRIRQHNVVLCMLAMGETEFEKRRNDNLPPTFVATHHAHNEKQQRCAAHMSRAVCKTIMLMAIADNSDRQN